MPQLNKDYLRGFLVPYVNKNNLYYDGTFHVNTNATAEEVIADTPVVSPQSRLFVGATGNTDPTLDLKISTLQAGITESATFVIQDFFNAGSSAPKLGVNQNTSITDFQILKGRSGTGSTTDEAYESDMLTFEDGSLLVVAKELEGTQTIKIRRYLRDKSGSTTVSDVFTYENDSSPTAHQGFPALCKLSDNTILLLLSQKNTDSQTVNFLAMRSQDRGNSFSEVGKRVLNEEILFNLHTIEQVRVRECNGQILLLLSCNSIAGTKKNTLLQYASIDGGGSFERVSPSNFDDQEFYRTDLFINRNQFCIAYIFAGNDIRFMRLPHAFYAVQDLQASGSYITINTGGGFATGSSGSGSGLEEGNLTAYSDYDSSIYVYANDRTRETVSAFYSHDSVTWATMESSGSVTQPNVFHISGTQLKNMKADVYQGGAALVYNWTDSTYGNSLGLTFYGQYATLTFPFRTNTSPSSNPLERMQHMYSYLPLVNIPLTYWTASGTGSESFSVTSGYNRIIVAGTETDRLFEKVFTSHPDKGIATKFVVHVTDTGGSGNPVLGYVKLQVDEDTGTHSSYKLVIKISLGQVLVYDNTTLIKTISYGGSEGIEIVASIVDDKACLFYRNYSTSNVKEYISAFVNQTLTSPTVTTTAFTSIQWGMEGSPTSSIGDSRWKQFLVYCSTGNGNITNFTESDLIGNVFPSLANKTYITQGVSIYSNGGPTYAGESWVINSFSFNGLDNLFPEISPSPRVQWRSEPVASGAVPEQRITFELSTNATNFGNDLVGLHLNNINFRQFEIQRRSSGTWVTVASVDASEGMNHGYVKQGKSIKQDPSNIVDQSYYFFDELKDCIAYVTGTGFDEYIKITGNSEGGFGNVSGKECIIQLESEPTNNGQVYILPKSVTAVLSLNGVTANLWAIRFPAQETKDKQFRVGSLVFGPVVVTGTQYSKGRKITIESGTTKTVTQDRTVFTRVTAPSQRTVQVSWSDGVDISSFYDNNPDPDYYKASSTGGAEAVSAYQDVPYLMDGLLRKLEGDASPLVYLPSITTGSDIRVYNRRDQHMLSRLDSEIVITSITGEELVGNGQGEVMRVGTIDLLEVV